MADPWKDLLIQKGFWREPMEDIESSCSSSSERNRSISDSLIPQFSQSINPAPDVDSILDDEESESGDKESKPLSDSMIPLVGDSLIKGDKTASIDCEKE